MIINSFGEMELILDTSNDTFLYSLVSNGIILIVFCFIWQLVSVEAI